jgi:DNA invertase Pin-like site-specific DNA recombinase
MTATAYARPEAAADTRPVASYARLSKIRGDGQGWNMASDRQHADNREYVAMALPDAADVLAYEDNGSGWDEDHQRADWDRLLADLAAGNLRAVVAWHADRFTRQPLQLERLLRAAKQGGAQVHTSRAGQVTDPTLFRIQGALAAAESDQKSARITRRHQQMAEQGEFHGGRRRFGYDHGMTAIREAEAAIVRDLAARLLAGETLFSLAAELNANQVPTATDQVGIWTGPNLRTMMLRPHLAGLRVHKGRVVGKATWAPILTEDTRDALLHLLTDPARRKSYSNARRYLLAGLATCDACGAPLRGRPANEHVPHPVYACSTGRHVHRAQADVDTVLADRIVARLEQTDASGALADDTAADAAADLRQQLADLDGRRESLADQWAAGDLDDSAHAAAQAAVTRKAAALTEALQAAREAARRPQAALEGMTGSGARQAWEAAPLARQRAIIDVLATVALVGAGGRRRRPFEPADVVVTWKAPA